MKQVFVIESGDYEQRSVDGVVTSPEAGLRYLQALHPHPFKVTWEGPKPDKEDFVIVGRFEQVQHFSTAHVCVYRLTPYQLQE